MRQSTGQSFRAPYGLTLEEAVDTVKRGNSWNPSKPCDRLAVEIAVQQVRMDEMRSKATNIKPQRTKNGRVEVESKWKLDDFHSSLAQPVHELVAVPRRRCPHSRLDPQPTKSGKERDQMPFAASHPLDLLHVKDAHTSHCERSAGRSRFNAGVG